VKRILEKIKKNQFSVGIIGLGYVGLPLLKGFASKNLKVVGLDIDKKKIDKLKKGISYIKHINISSLYRNKKILFTNNFRYISNVDLIILCLPTPLKKNKLPDLSYIIKTLSSIKDYLQPYQTISLESTTYPGTTREIIYPILKKKFEVGKNFYLIYSPEREDPGRKDMSLQNIPKVLGGFSNNCKIIGKEFYQKFFKKIILTKNIETAEFTKIFENVFRAVNISLVNEIKYLSNKIGVNFHEVIKASSTKPFGFMPFYPGPGIGGHCIPIDPLYLSYKAKKIGIEMNLIKTSFNVNYLTTKRIANTVIKKAKNKNSKILIVGIAYKKNIDDVRESPALKIMELLTKKNLSFDYHDPYIKELPENRNFYQYKKSIKISAKKIKNYDLIMLVTDHDIVNWKMIQKNAKLIIDTRDVYKKNYANVIKA
jgi:UDP-N-acetyl-D-glucosamine dehydrogenase